MKHTVGVDPDWEYRMLNDFVFTGEQLIEAIKKTTWEHRTGCDSISPMPPKTPGFACELKRGHQPVVHEAARHMRWWEMESGEIAYEWLSERARDRWKERQRSVTAYGEKLSEALDGISSTDAES